MSEKECPLSNKCNPFLCRCKSFVQKLQSKFNECFTLSFSKKSMITGLVFTVLLLTFAIIDCKAFAAQTFKTKWLLFAFTLVTAFCAGFLIAAQFHIKKEKVSKTIHWLVFFLMPFFMTATVECLNGVFFFNMTLLGLFGNYILLLILYLLFYAITGSFRFSQMVVNIPLFILAVAHCYVLEFRGSPLIPWDFFGVVTAKNVAATYDYTPTYNMITATVLMTILITVSIKTHMPHFRLITKILTRVFSGLFACGALCLYYFTPLLINIGVKPDFWKQERGYHDYGFSLMFFLNTRYLGTPDPPNGYDANDISSIISKTVNTDFDESTAAAPNIICIMNESFSDLSVLGDLKTDKEYMPYFNSLKENTVRGNLYVPVIGAGTSNTEFEFLTGHSTAFLPSGSNPYMLYIRHPIATIVSTLKGQSYSTLAYHPYYASGWNRVKVYDHMGFDRFLSIESMFTEEYIESYEKYAAKPESLIAYTDVTYPNESILLRQYVSDSYDYKYLIEDFKNRDKTKPYFTFNITMQNHGGYLNSYSNFNEDVHILSPSGNFPKATQYLSLMRQSDLALKELLDYLKSIDEPTVVCFFGDHQPSVENELVTDLLDAKSVLSLTDEQEEKRHITPFIIWANYDIEECYYDRLSVNFLSSLVLEVAGVRLTPYNRYLLNLKDTIPVIDTVGYYDKKGTHYSWNENSPYNDLINDYEIVQYNNIFDYSNRDNNAYFINGDSTVIDPPEAELTEQDS